MLNIKLTRTGSRNHPFYRVVVTQARSKKNTMALEIVGYWEPRKNLKKINTERLSFWVAQGARPTRTVRKLMEI